MLAVLTPCQLGGTLGFGPLRPFANRTFPAPASPGGGVFYALNRRTTAMMQTMNSAPARNTAIAAGKPSKSPAPMRKPGKSPMPSYPGYPKAGGNKGGVMGGHV